MEELMRRMGQEPPAQERILELNPGHPLVARLQSLFAQGVEQPAARQRLAGYVQVLRDQAVLAEGGRIADPAGFAKRVQELLLSAAVPPAAAAASAGA
jgi:molecular chaperone HtpG